MKYTYERNLGGGHSYLHFIFDRQISSRSVYRMGMFLRKYASAKEIDLMNAIANTVGVIKTDDEMDCSGSGSELINLDGSNITVKISSLYNIGEIVKQIVKKVQWRYAQGESRKRVSISELQRVIEAKNNITFGQKTNVYQIKDYNKSITRFLSKELYVIIDDSFTSGYYQKGTVVRLISGVDENGQPGYHFCPGHKTVCRQSAGHAEYFGIPEKSLVKIYV